MKNKMKKEEKGITLIALVITIIVLLILAGVSISMLSGENGILNRAAEAKEETERATMLEKVQLAVLAAQASGNGDINLGVLNSELKEAGYEGETISSLPKAITIGDYEFTIAEDGKVNEGNVVVGDDEENDPIETIPTTENYVGYYADIEGDGTVDGIIYADLAVGGEGIWNNYDWSNYSYEKVTEGLKSYTVSEEEYTGFGTWTKPILTAVEGSGTVDRFYVMALEDFNTGTTYCWYDAAYGSLDNAIATDYNDFGEGKENTKTMIKKWNEETYGAQNDNGTYADMWGAIQTVVGDINNPTWFVPSKAEWEAFGDFAFTKMGVTTSNYGNYGLSVWYWSSAQYTTGLAYDADFINGYIFYDDVDIDYYVRLGATF